MTELVRDYERLFRMGWAWVKKGHPQAIADLHSQSFPNDRLDAKTVTRIFVQSENVLCRVGDEGNGLCAYMAYRYDGAEKPSSSILEIASSGTEYEDLHRTELVWELLESAQQSQNRPVFATRVVAEGTTAETFYHNQYFAKLRLVSPDGNRARHVVRDGGTKCLVGVLVLSSIFGDPFVGVDELFDSAGPKIYFYHKGAVHQLRR